MTKVCEVSVGDFFTQKLSVGDIVDHSWKYCIDLCRYKKVLHVGCSDHPIFDVGSSLHLQLVGVASDLHGVDPNGIDLIKPHYDGVYYKDISVAEKHYDVILVPNVIEHLENPGDMVKSLFQINFKKLFVIVPNYSISVQATHVDGIFTERVHPDHFAWYSPYTLWNLFRKEIERVEAECELNFFDNKSMVSITITRSG